jgi:hypothetical protein
MVSSEVQRTLVKSPPELWAELSDPDSLGRHLHALGDIRITRVEPEQRVEWEADRTTGTVAIKPTGWGTKVTLSVERELQALAGAPAGGEESEPSSAADGEKSEPSSAAEIDATADTDAAPDTPGGTDADIEPGLPARDAERATEADAETAAEATPAREPRRGFFARLFGRRARPSVPEPAAAAVPAEPEIAEPPAQASAPVATEPAATATTAEKTATAAEASEDPPHDLAAELRAVEEAAEEEVTAVLTAVLDRLGAAHHRPFSRS